MPLFSERARGCRGWRPRTPAWRPRRRHAVPGEEALLLGDRERRGIGQRDVAEDRLGHFRPGGLRDVDTEGKLRIDRADERGGAGAGFQKRPAAQSAPAVASRFSRHCARRPFLRSCDPVDAPACRFPSFRRFVFRSKPIKKPQPRSASLRIPQDSGVAYRPVIGPVAPESGGALRSSLFKCRASWRLAAYFLLFQ